MQISVQQQELHANVTDCSVTKLKQQSKSWIDIYHTWTLVCLAVPVPPFMPHATLTSTTCCAAQCTSNQTPIRLAIKLGMFASASMAVFLSNAR